MLRADVDAAPPAAREVRRAAWRGQAAPTASPGCGQKKHSENSVAVNPISQRIQSYTVRGSTQVICALKPSAATGADENDSGRIDVVRCHSANKTASLTVLPLLP